MKIRIVLILVLFWVLYQLSVNWGNDLKNVAEVVSRNNPDYQAYSPPKKE